MSSQLDVNLFLRDVALEVGRMVGRPVVITWFPVVQIPKELAEENNDSGYTLPKLIIHTVCDVFNVSFADVASKTRDRHISDARHISMFIIKTKVALITWKAVAQFYGRDHSTVMHACAKVEDLIETDRDFKNRYDACIMSVQKAIDKYNSIKLYDAYTVLQEDSAEATASGTDAREVAETTPPVDYVQEVVQGLS